ncbi:MAG: ABC transporter permease, partial [Firmicutes bacterium HGW-Firmicutes-13]
MRPKTWVYFIKEAFKSIFRNGWMSFASAGVVMITLFLLGSFMLLNFNLDIISSDIKSQIEIIAFVDENVIEEQLDRLRVKIISLPEAEEVKFVSRDEALNRLEQRLGEHGSLLAGYKEPGNNPLSDSFEVKSRIPEGTSELARKIKILPGIARVDYGSEVVDKLFNVTRIINWVGLVFMLALGMTAMFLIANTIKLTVFS